MIRSAPAGDRIISLSVTLYSGEPADSESTIWSRPQLQPTNSLTLSAFDVNQSQHLYIERASTAGCSHIYKRFPSEWHRTKTHTETKKFEREIESNIKKKPTPFLSKFDIYLLHTQ